MTDTRLLMTIRPSTPKSSTLHVLEDAYFKVSINRQEHFLLIIRSDTVLTTADEARAAHTKLVEAVAPYLRFRVMVDLRRAKGNSNDAIELVIREVWFPTVMQFHPLAVIVGTAAGRLHVGRMFREHGSKGKIFQSEHEARQFLGLPWPIPP
jgi:hypothetical protein